MNFKSDIIICLKRYCKVKPLSIFMLLYYVFSISDCVIFTVKSKKAVRVNLVGCPFLRLNVSFRNGGEF